jgi:hypothetical protein
MQIQAVADVLAGYTVRYRLKEFEEPWRTGFRIAQRIALGEGQDFGEGMRSAMGDRDDTRSIISAIMERRAGWKPNGVPSMADLADDLPPIAWLWKGWLPVGMLSVLGSRPGSGKSLLGADLIWRITANRGMPDGQPVPVQYAGRPCIYVDAENVPQLLLKRIRAWGMDENKLHLLIPDEQDFMIDLSNDKYRERLIEATAVLEPPLIVFDSFSRLTSKGENNIEDVRDVLSFLTGLAKDRDTNVLLIHHVGKPGVRLIDTMELADLRGSSDIGAAARTVLGLVTVQTGPEPDPNGPRRLKIVKSNLGRYPEPIGINLKPLVDDEVMLEYGEPPKSYREPSEVDLCADWLENYLEDAGGSAHPKDVFGAAKGEGFSEATVRRSKKQLENIKATGTAYNPDILWEIIKT